MLTAIEAMLAEQEKHKRSAIKALQAAQWERTGDVWNPREELLREAVLELWVTLTLMLEVQAMLQRPRWRRLLRRWSR